jgi:hypothetical protein
VETDSAISVSTVETGDESAMASGTETETETETVRSDGAIFATPKPPFRSHTKKTKRTVEERVDTNIAGNLGGMMAAVSRATSVDPIALVISDRLATLSAAQKYAVLTDFLAMVNERFPLPGCSRDETDEEVVVVMPLQH